MVEAVRCGFAQGTVKAEGLDAQAFVSYYLSRKHRDDRGVYDWEAVIIDGGMVFN
ncbi:hypothetical protein [Stutzerimonas nitrititolerans]|uniref:hypothetical protein n=1 Tax=Stutzerimonas nitrititolerans TaxID=2482751 RepID=UPI0035E3D8BA